MMLKEQYTFILQKTNRPNIDSEVLKEQIEYYNWINPYDSYLIIELEDLSKISFDIMKNINYYIPVGTIEWVESFIKKYNLPNKNMVEIYEPSIQTHLNKGNLLDIQNNILKEGKLFVKETSKFKTDFADIYGYIFTTDNLHYLSKDEYYYSKVFEILSEYRLFVFNNQIVGINNYSGDNLLFPTNEEIDKCKKIAKDYNNQGLKAYTLDIALTTEGIKFLEIHPFFSCGLYGFNHRYIPQMYINGFKYLTKKFKRNK